MGKGAYKSTLSGTKTMEVPFDQHTEKEVKVLVCPSSGVQNMESNINRLANQLSNLMLVVKKNPDWTLQGACSRQASGCVL